MSRTISISDSLYAAIEKLLDEYGFETVDEYVEFVLQELVQEDTSETEMTEEEEAEVKKRLRDLGYIE